LHARPHDQARFCLKQREDGLHFLAISGLVWDRNSTQFGGVGRGFYTEVAPKLAAKVA
jgi:hypothetical protein